MNIYLSKVSEYYDLLYSQKNYNNECYIIKKYSVGKKLLDIGAGTLSHSIILSGSFDKILATDFSKEMISIGEKKIKKHQINNIETYIGTLENLKTRDEKYSTAILMFNVVNHIIELEELKMFFFNISELLMPDAVLIFDCWNGINCIIDPPKKIIERKVGVDDFYAVSKTKTTLDSFNLICNMVTNIEIVKNFDLVESFDYKITHRIWTPDLLCELLCLTSFEVVKIIPFFDDDKVATQDDSRITFICKKK